MTDQPASNPVEGKALAAQLEQARKALRDIDMAVCGLCEYPDVPPHPRDVVERVTILVAEREDLAVDLAKSDTELANAQGALSRDKTEILKAFAKFRDGARSRTDAAERLRDEALNAKIAAQTAAGCLRAERDEALAVIDRVRELHRPHESQDGDVVCPTCVCGCGDCDFNPLEAPCPTIRALDGGDPQ